MQVILARGADTMTNTYRRPQVCVLGSADPGSKAYVLAGDVGELLAR